MANHADRPKTIAANGEIVPKPYGAGRWHSPRRYDCAHDGCDQPATIVAAADSHELADGVSKTHNCCGNHA